MPNLTETSVARQATILDVAKAAGVAVGTVSRYLNGQPIRASNRTAVEQAIDALGYRRNIAAASMKTNTTHVIGMMLPGLGQFHAGLLDQLSRRMRQAGRAVLSFCHDTEVRTYLEGLEFFANHRVDAVVMDGNEAVGDRLTPYIERGLIVVLYDNDKPDLLADRVFVENRKASQRLVEHLLDLGHQRIGIIHGRLIDSAGRERLAGYRDALAARNMDPDPALEIDGRWNEAGGYSGVRELLAANNPPTAVFGSNYDMSIGALRWLREHGVSVPTNVSLVSFDDVQAFSLYQPGITAVGQPVTAVAEAITNVLDERLGSPGAVGRRTVQVDANIILRGSTAPLSPLKLAVGGGR